MNGAIVTARILLGSMAVTVLALFLTWAHRDAYAPMFATSDRASARAKQRRAA